MALRTPLRRHRANRPTGLAARVAGLLGITLAGLAGSPSDATAAPARPAPVAFECTFTEPFASLWIGGGRVHGAGPDLAPTSAPVTGATIGAGGRTATVAFAGFGATGAKAGAGDRLELTKGAAGDGMSNRRWGWSVRWRRAGAVLVGACDRLDDGAAPRQVTGVANGDVLHVRATASAGARSLASVPPGATVWRRVGATAGAGGAWQPVAAVTVGPDGTTRLVRGWANGRYLSPLR